MTITTIPVMPGSKDFQDLRDRAAYVHLTGAMPTHLRTYMVELLNKISRFTGAGQNSIEIARHNANVLGLDDHPMVRKTRELLDDGYKLMVNRDIKSRRPYGRVFLWKDLGHGAVSQVTVQADGSVLSHWS